MPARPSKKAAIAAIERLGACLVFPQENRPEPASLWSVFHPKSEMRWEWDEAGDDRVVELWHLRAELSASGKVAYAKWFRGRGTFFSLELFAALVGILARDEDLGLGETALTLYRSFEESSPLSPKEVKRATELQGRANERTYERGMKELWSRLLVVGYGEREEGAFPSLLVGATKWLFEEAWRAGLAMPEAESRAVIDRFLPVGNLFRREFERVRSTLPRRRE